MADEPSNNYILLGVHAIGGPTGDYTFSPEMSSDDWAEFRVINIANGTVGPTYVQISAVSPPTPLAWDGTKTVNNQFAYPNLVYVLGANGIPIPPSPWIRIIDQPGILYVRIDTPLNNACYVSLQCRSRILKKIPQPFVTVRPEDEQLVHAMREAKIQQAVLGIPGEEYAYATRPIEDEPIVEPPGLARGEREYVTRQPVTKLGYWGRILR
ncbi:MAG: hypothetical protein KGL95_14395 [Patescibacteria group bacterium]|nr:hypothetical protein [Patescibacteria group bacterium]